MRLARPARLRVVITEVAPVCRRVGAFTVRGRAGVNRIVFRGRFGGRPLPLGTYRVTVKAHGRTLAYVTIVVASSRPTARALAAARAANACVAALIQSFGVPVATRGPIELSSDASATGRDASAGQSKSAGAPTAGVPSRSQVLGAGFSKSPRGFDATRALLLLSATMAVLLLGLASLPAAVLSDPRLIALVETRRIELALAGALTLLAAVLVYLGTGG